VNSARRRKARELLVQALYSHRVGGVELSDAIVDQVERRRPHAESLEYVRDLQAHFESGLAPLDELIDQHLQTRTPERVGQVERSILQIGVVELLHRPDVPTGVIIAEAAHLVRTFTGEDSVGFVHALLDKVGREVRAEAD
jgi:N utilization substance protein B